MTPYVETGLAPLVEQAKQDLARQLKVSAGEVTVLEARSVTWADGALGCPQPGMAYIQVLVEGALIRLRVGDALYEYHSGRNQAPFRCPPDRIQPPSGEGGGVGSTVQ